MPRPRPDLLSPKWLCGSRTLGHFSGPERGLVATTHAQAVSTTMASELHAAHETWQGPGLFKFPFLQEAFQKRRQLLRRYFLPPEWGFLVGRTPGCRAPHAQETETHRHPLFRTACQQFT